MTLNEFNDSKCQSDEVLKRLKNGESINNESIVLKKPLYIDFIPKGKMVNNKICTKQVYNESVALEFKDSYALYGGLIYILINKNYNNWFFGNTIISSDNLNDNSIALYLDSKDVSITNNTPLSINEKGINLNQ